MLRNNVFKAVSLLWLGAILGAGFAFFSQIILARSLGPEEFGVFSSALATLTLVVPLAGFGVAAYWLKVFGEEGWAAIRWWRSSFSFICLTTALVIVGVTLWAFYGPHNQVFTVIVLALLFHILGQLLLELVSSRFQLEERFVSLAIWQMLPHAMRFCALLVLWWSLEDSFNAYYAAVVYSLVAAIFFFVGLSLLRSMCVGSFLLKGHGDKKAYDSFVMPSVIDVMKGAWPFGVGGAFYLIYFQSAVVVISYLDGVKSAGIYNVAFVVMTAVYLFPSVIYQRFLLSKIHRWAAKDRDSLLRSYRLGNFYMLIFGIAAMCVIWLCAFWAIPWLFGRQFSESVVILNIIALAAPVRFLATSVGSMLVTQDHMKEKVFYMGCVAVVNVLLNVVAVPVYGVVGAAFVTVVSDVLLLLLYYYSVRKHFLRA